MASREREREIKVKGTEAGYCNKLQVPWSSVSDDGSKAEVLSRIAQAIAASVKLKPIWRDSNVSLGSDVKLMT